ncbi:MAG: carbohydrate kinase family protein [Proteiniphilum sp.]
MKGATFKISGVGCALVDYLYKPVSFTSDEFRRYISVNPGDGGLSPGKLVFRDEFEDFTGENYLKVRDEITNGNTPIAVNIGGPSIVSLIHASQMLEGLNAEIFFYGSKGNDKGAAFIDENLQKTPLKVGKYKISEKYTPFTDVLSDPDYDHGHGERIFINNIGAAWDLFPEDLDNDFFDSDITIFGGTALVPHIHESLFELLQKAKEKNAITIVNTVYDSLNEKKNPNKAWPLGSSMKTYQYVDLLIADMEEALRLSGTGTIEESLKFFKKVGVGGVIVTHGANPLYYFCDSRLLGTSEGNMPVSEKIKNTMIQQPEKIGDTTGCGDNFAGGVISSIAEQLIESPGYPVDIRKALAIGVVSGGFACLYHGGTFYEKYPGEKKEKKNPIYQEYLKQINIE